MEQKSSYKTRNLPYVTTNSTKCIQMYPNVANLHSRNIQPIQLIPEKSLVPQNLRGWRPGSSHWLTWLQVPSCMPGIPSPGSPVLWYPWQKIISPNIYTFSWENHLYPNNQGINGGLELGKSSIPGWSWLIFQQATWEMTPEATCLHVIDMGIQPENINKEGKKDNFKRWKEAYRSKVTVSYWKVTDLRVHKNSSVAL